MSIDVKYHNSMGKQMCLTTVIYRGGEAGAEVASRKFTRQGSRIRMLFYPDMTV